MKPNKKPNIIDLALVAGVAFCWSGVFALSIWYGAMILGVAP